MIRTILLSLSLSSPISADTLVPGYLECFRSVNEQGGLSQCVAKAHANCDAILDDSSARVKCFVSARDQWGQALKLEVAAIPEKQKGFQSLVRIEAKYATLRHLMACDYRNEVSLIEREETAEDQVNHSTCQATAMGLALAEILIRSGSIR